MDEDEFRDVIQKLKDELRKQTNLWSHQLRSDRTMNLTLEKRAERVVEKSKILQKIRIKHAEKLLHCLETEYKLHAFDPVDEIQTYWQSILPEINDVLSTFREINSKKEFSNEIEKLELPEELNIILLKQRPDMNDRIQADNNALDFDD